MRPCPWSCILQSVEGSQDGLAGGCETFSGGLALEETEIQCKQKSSAWLKPCPASSAWGGTGAGRGLRKLVAAGVHHSLVAPVHLIPSDSFILIAMPGAPDSQRK